MTPLNDKLISFKCLSKTAVIVTTILLGTGSATSLAQNTVSGVSSYNKQDEATRTPTRMKIDLNDPNIAQPQPIPSANVPTANPITHRRINSINERIELLKRLVENERVTAQNTARSAAEVAAENSRKISEPQPVNQTTAASNQPIDSTAPTDGQPQSGDRESLSPESAEPPAEEFESALSIEAPEQPSTSGTQILGGPVDSFELGNSLFLTGNYSAAIKSYQAQMEKDIAPGDKDWIGCLIGCCYRLQNNFKAAESTFRAVTQNKQGNPFAVDYAKWSLSYVDKRRLALSDFEVIEQEINSILAEKTK